MAARLVAGSADARRQTGRASATRSTARSREWGWVDLALAHAWAGDDDHPGLNGH